MTKAYSFIRFSTPEQSKGDSLRRQLAKSERFAEARGLELDTSLRAYGVSAYRGGHRKKGPLAAFLAQIEAGEIAAGSYLIVENIDRLSRETPWNAFPMMQQIINGGIIVVTLIDGTEYSLQAMRDDPGLMAKLQAVMTKGHLESRDKGDRLAEVWGEKREADLIPGNGKVFTRQGPAWLTFVPDDPTDYENRLYGKLVTNDRAALVVRIFEMARDGLGKAAIAKTLNDEGVPTFKHGDGWQPSTVLYLLRDRRVLGEFQPHRKIAVQDSVRKIRQPVGEPIKGYFEPIVSEELFYQVQRALEIRHSGARVGTAGKVPNLFVRIAHCGECGRVMEFKDRNSSKQQWCAGNVNLRCSGRLRGQRLCMNQASFAYHETEAMILDWVTDIVLSGNDANRATVAGLKLSAKEAERDDLQRRLDRALSDFEKEADDDFRAHFLTRARALKRDIATVEAEIAALTIDVKTNKRSVLDDRRANVAKARAEMITAEGDALYLIRAKLAGAVRQVIERVEFHSAMKEIRVFLHGGRKAVRFIAGKFDSYYEAPEIREVTERVGWGEPRGMRNGVFEAVSPR